MGSVGALWVITANAPSTHCPLSISGEGQILPRVSSGICLPTRFMERLLGSHRLAGAP